MWCKSCCRNCEVHRLHCTGYICCVECGKVVEQDEFTEDATFTKGPRGESRMDGSFVNSVEDDHKESYKRTLEKGKKHIQNLAVLLDMNDEGLKKQATQFYRIVIERYEFTRGRNTKHVAGACLYIACRANNKPYLLIDFAMSLGVNVYVLGAVYLQLCILLSFQNQGFVQTVVDPSLFMHRFTYDLLKDESDKVRKSVLKTALLIVASMKRDWMQTGRKPSGICGAALYVAALSHGYTYSKTEILKRVHICEATLTNRLIEFEETSSGSLTIEEFTQNAEKFEREKRFDEMSNVNANKSDKSKEANKSDKSKVLCKHKDSEPHFAHGLCKRCYEDFLEISGGLNGGSEPPSFQAAELNRMAQASAEKERCSDEVNDEATDNVCNTKKGAVPEAESASMPGNDGEIPSVADETENLSDVDDTEVNCYLASKEESRLKKIVWEAMNKEYLQEQAAKEAAAAAYMKDLGDAPDDVLEARKLAYAASMKKKREQQRRKSTMEAKNTRAPQTAAEAARQMLTKKRLSSKINYDNLDNLFDEDLPLDTKKARTEEIGKGAKERNLNEEEEKEVTIEDDVGEEEEVYDEDATYDQNEYYYDEDDKFYD